MEPIIVRAQITEPTKPENKFKAWLRQHLKVPEVVDEDE